MGQIEGSHHYNYLAYDFWDRIEKLDPEGLYLVYCRSGRRSLAMARRVLALKPGVMVLSLAGGVGNYTSDEP